MNEMTRVARNGSWVTMIMKTSAGSNGPRRAQSPALRMTVPSEPGGAVRRLGFTAAGFLASMDMSRTPHFAARERYRSATSSASVCPRFKASSTLIRPAIAELTS